MRLRSLPILLLATLGTTSATARWDDPEAGLPLIETYALEHLGVANNWAVVADARGRIYVGNDNVFEYDGDRWSVVPVGQGNSVVSLVVDEANRIWCGGAGELGLIEEDAAGVRVFRSLVPLLPPSATNLYVYAVHRQKGCTLFVTRDSLLVWDGARFDVKQMSGDLRPVSFEFEGAAYIQRTGWGLWRWDGRSTEKVSWAEGENHGRLRGAWRDSNGDAIYLSDRALLRVRSDRAEPFAESSILEIAEGSIGSAIRIPDGHVVISTSSAGIYIINEDGRILRHLDRGEGLPNLTASPIFLDPMSRAWVGSYNHVATFNSRHVQTAFDARNGNGGDAVGIVSSVDAGTLCATMEGVGRLVRKERHAASFDPLPPLRGLHGAIGTLNDGRMIAGGRGQLVSVHAEGVVPILTGCAGLFQFAPLDASAARIAIVEGASISILDLAKSDPRQGKLENFPEAPARLVSDAQGSLWAGLRRNGVVKIDHPNQQHETRRRFRPGEDLPSPFNDAAVFILNQHAFAFASNAIVALPARNSTPPRVVLQGVGLLAAERNGTGSLWAVANMPGREPRLVRITENETGELDLHVTDQGFRDIGNITVFSKTDDHLLWIGGSEGTIRIDSREVGEERAPQEPLVQAVSWRVGEQLVRLPLAGNTTLEFARTGVIAFQLRDSADPLAKTQLIETRLAGAGDADWRLTGKSYSIPGLDEGRYTLEARVVGFLGNPGPVVQYGFTINPPWFRTPLAYAGYVLVFGGSLFGAAQWRTRRIRRQNAQLEQIVNRRTEELAQAVSARSAFLANMGHEIRNPLNGVVGLVDTLRTRELAPEQKGIVDRIGTCADQLISVIDDVLEYARIDAGRITLRTRAFAVREPVEACIDIFRSAQPTAVIDLEADPAELDNQVRADPDRIRHILVNYLANALKFGGGTPVTVGVRREGALLIFSVRDRGPGLSAEEQARLFVRFSRGSLAYKNAIPGTGLGLAACKAYAEAMGGDVSVESEPGAGATFFLRIPYQPAAATETAAGTPPAELLMGRKALVVDDQDFNRFVLADLLGRMGATAVQAASVEEAKEAFRARVPDIVFVDFDLSGATGADLADWIRKESPAGRDVPIVATTAFEVDEVRRRCEEAAMDGFLSKPVTAQRLNEVVARIESVRSGGQSPIVPTSTAAAPSSSFLDILAGGDRERRKELERSTWGEVLTEALATHRALRREDGPIAARHAHRLVSAALILGHREIVTTARELNGLAKAGDLPAAREAAMRLRRHIRALRTRQIR